MLKSGKNYAPFSWESKLKSYVFFLESFPLCFQTSDGVCCNFFSFNFEYKMGRWPPSVYTNLKLSDNICGKRYRGWKSHFMFSSRKSQHKTVCSYITPTFALCIRLCCAINVFILFLIFSILVFIIQTVAIDYCIVLQHKIEWYTWNDFELFSGILKDAT